MDHLLELLAYLHKSTFERSNKQKKLQGYQNRFFVITQDNSQDKKNTDFINK